MSEWLAQAVSVLFLALIQLRFPTAKPAVVMPWQRGNDPAYAVYQRYRYAYDTYGYLFLSSEDNHSGNLNGGVGEIGGESEDNPIHREGVATDTGEEGESAPEPNQVNPDQVPLNQEPTKQENSGQENPGQENTEQENSDQGTGSREQRVESAREVFADYEAMMKHFYIVHSSTVAGADLMNVNAFLDTDLTLQQDSSVPQILIYHTHSQETYRDFGPGNPSARVTAIGEILEGLLRERGWNVIHDTTPYDMEGGSLDRSRAYTYALDGITRILEENPTIQVVLDVHRDGVGENVHLVSEVDGKPTANIMFFQGMSQTQDGPISYLPNPYLKENLAFSFQLQLACAQRAPGFTRKIYLKSLRYNLHVRPRSALIEVGAQTNTGEEAVNAMSVLAEVLDMVLQGK